MTDLSTAQEHGVAAQASEANAGPFEVTEQRLLTQTVLRAKLARLALRGVNATKAAELTGISTATSREIYRDRDFRRDVLSRLGSVFEDVDDEFEIKTQTLHEKLEEQALSSFEELVNITQSPLAATALKAKIHLSFLDRVAETSQKNVRVDGGALTSNVLMQASKAAREMDLTLVKKEGAA